VTAHSSSFYNDFDPSASCWLDNLQRNNKIPKGVVPQLGALFVTSFLDTTILAKL
jgi:hypothetical protein